MRPKKLISYYNLVIYKYLDMCMTNFRTPLIIWGPLVSAILTKLTLNFQLPPNTIFFSKPPITTYILNTRYCYKHI